MLKWFLPFVLFLLVQCAVIEDGGPIIREFSFLGQDENSLDIFYFKIRWEDYQGDLAFLSSNERGNKGKLTFVVEDPDSSSTFDAKVDYWFRIESSGDLQEIVVMDGQTAGDLSRIGIVLVSETGNYPQYIRVTLTMWDREGHRSNQPSVLIKTSI